MASRAVTDPTETEFQGQVIQLAHMLGWRHLHVRRTIGRGHKWVTSTNVVGWPDLLLWHEVQHRVVAAELKSSTGVTTPEQIDVLRSLSYAGMETFVWRPADLEMIKKVLANPVTMTP